MADKILETLRIDLKDGLTEAIIKNLVDDLRKEEVLNKDATEEILQKTKARPDQARDMIDSVQVKGPRACVIFFESLKKHDKTLYEKLNLASVLEKPLREQGATSSVGHVKQDKQKTENDEYEMSSIPRGLCVIINNENFKDPKKKRMGSHLDAASLEVVFTFLGFVVENHKDLKADEIKSLMIKYSKDDRHKDSDCFVCCVLSHGNKEGVSGKDDKICSLKDIKSPFDGVNCPALIDKPKVFFIQACRGCEMQRKVVVSDDLGEEPNQEPDNVLDEYTIPSGSDFLMVMSTVEGCYSIRNPKSGSWFIQSLCKYLKEGSERGHDILKILTEVNDNVSRKESTVRIKKEIIDAKMIPEPHFTLRKTLIFKVPK